MTQQLHEQPAARLTRLLSLLGVASSSWYHHQHQASSLSASASTGPRRRGPAPRPIPQPLVEGVLTMARGNPWYGYKRIAVMCRRVGVKVTDRQCYRVMKQHDLLHKRRARVAEVYQSAKLWELLPKGPNELWQMDVTYIHIPGHGWWYAVTVIDYYSRYLLTAYLTHSYSAWDATMALSQAKREAERLHGPLMRPPFLVTDNGSSFIARRFTQFVQDQFSHVRIAYRTPTQLGLLERFHQTLKVEEVYWRLYDNPAHARQCLAEFRDRYNTQRPHWALRPKDGGDPLTPQDVYEKRLATELPKWQTWAVAARKKLDQMLHPEAA